MAPTKSIIFGPTGRVGSAAARSAKHYGSQVVLAMRDTQKPIPSLSPEQEREGGYERIEADLTKPDTVQAAVNKTSAKRAFIYVDFSASDYMKSTITALKLGGIEFVVLLSSWSVRGDVKAIQPGNFLAWTHAQVEINLGEVFGQDGFVAVRPAWFASNALWYKNQIPNGEVKLAFPEPKVDWVSPEDIGELSGAFLTRGSQCLGSTDEANAVYVPGPEQLSQRNAIGIIAKAIGKNIKVTQVGEQEGQEVFVRTTGLPERLVKQLLLQQKTADKEGPWLFVDPHYETALGNVKKYLAREPMRFHEWVEENKQEFVI